MDPLLDKCRQIKQQLAAQGGKLVLAESCTAGLVAASFGQIPGISAYWCGSAVTYRNETKVAWLGVPPEVLVDPGVVSDLVAERMAREVLARTPEADLATSITGHLGPDAPAELDGVVFIGLASRRGPEILAHVQRIQLQSRSRESRQREAAEAMLQAIQEELGREQAQAFRD